MRLRSESNGPAKVNIPDDSGMMLKSDAAKGGYCILASRSFQPGELVCEYAGELLVHAEAEEREHEYMRRHEGPNPPMCYMFFFQCQGRKWCVDATQTSRLARFINHSRKASNLRATVKTVDETPRLLLIATRSIQAGEELLYDYGDRSKSAVESHPWLLT